MAILDSGNNQPVVKGSHSLEAPFVALEARFDENQPSKLIAISGLKFRSANHPEVYFAEDEHGYREFIDFCMGCAIIVHDAAPAIAALSQYGELRSSEIWDVQEIAELLHPETAEEDLFSLATKLGVDAPSSSGKNFDEQYLYSITLGNVYEFLLRELKALPLNVIQRLLSLLLRSQSTLYTLMAEISASSTYTSQDSMKRTEERDSVSRLERPRSLGQPSQFRAVEPEFIAELLEADGLIAQKFPEYEPRLEQLTMSQSISEAFGSTKQSIEAHHLVVEGGTGIGKSVAYLLPAILFAIRNNVRIVISTNTISLQEQLIKKDIPDLVDALNAIEDIDLSDFRYSQLKGRANYVCLKRWESLANSEAITSNEASTLAKTVAWLRNTRTGDRSELHLNQGELKSWTRINASAFANCLGVKEGACFYNHAKEKAASAHLIVVNHALLLSDIEVGGSLIPDYQYLIIDEAHNLESEATKQFGFQISSAGILEASNRCKSIYSELLGLIQISPIDYSHKEILQRHTKEFDETIANVDSLWGELISELEIFLLNSRISPSEMELRITNSVRTMPDWTQLDIKADDFERTSSQLADVVNRLRRELEDIPSEKIKGIDAIKSELSDWISIQSEIRGKINNFISNPDPKIIYWMSKAETVTLNSAPLEVASKLREDLFGDKKTVVLTSATMAVMGSFNHIIERLGISEPRELCLGSPFDYKNAALLYLPTDVPAPTSDNYQNSMALVIQRLVEIANGKTMVLFTSHSAVRNISADLKSVLPVKGYEVLAQDIDGTPAQLINRFQRKSKSVLLGTSSFWEGVDIGNDALKVLIIARLPFNVPSDPIFSARSDEYENAFFDYAVPQAILRFRQGFGRLIRSKADRGVAVIMDSRITSKSYGKRFIDSVPPATVIKGKFDESISLINTWLNSENATNNDRSE